MASWHGGSGQRAADCNGIVRGGVWNLASGVEKVVTIETMNRLERQIAGGAYNNPRDRLRRGNNMEVAVRAELGLDAAAGAGVAVEGDRAHLLGRPVLLAIEREREQAARAQQVAAQQQQEQQPAVVVAGAAVAVAAEPPIAPPKFDNNSIFNELVSFKWTAVDERWTGVCRVCDQDDLKSFVRGSVPDTFNIANHMNKHTSRLSDDFWSSEACKPTVHLTAAQAPKAQTWSRTAISGHWSVAEMVSAAKDSDGNPWFRQVAREFVAARARSHVNARRNQAQLDFGPKNISKKARTALALCVHSATTSSSFRSLESPALAVMLERCGMDAKDIPTRRDISNSLPAVYGHAIALLEAELRAADSFSVCFDLWSSRRLKNSFIALVFRWVDNAGYLHEQIFDLIHMGARAHTGNNIALLVAQRIDLHTSLNQFLAGSLTDNARNVIKASRRIVFQLALLLREGVPADVVDHDQVDVGDRQRLIAEVDDLRAADDAELEDFDEGADDDDVVDLANLDDIELARVARCAIHSMMLAINATVKHANCAALNAAIRKADQLTVAVLRSTKLQHTFHEYQRLAGEQHDKRALVRRAPTRWHSLHDSAASVARNGDVLQAMIARQCFAECSVRVDDLTDRDVAMLEDVVHVLEPIKVACKLLECRDVFILPVLPFLVKQIFDALGRIRDNAAADRQDVRTFGNVLLAALHERLDKYITDGHQPSLMCALLAPWCGTRGLVHLGIGDEVIRATFASLMVWCTDIENAINPDGLHGENNNRFLGDVGVRQAAVAVLGAGVERVVSLVSGPSHGNVASDAQEAHALQYPVPVGEWSVGLVADLTKQVREFYFSPVARGDIAVAKRVVSVLYGLGGSNAVCEQALSATGRTDSALRSRLAPTTLERLTIVQEYCARRKIDIKQFLNSLEQTAALSL